LFNGRPTPTPLPRRGIYEVKNEKGTDIREVENDEKYIIYKENGKMKKELVFKKSKMTKDDAAAFSNAASKFKSEIYLLHMNKKVNAKSLMGVLAVSLSLRTGDGIMLTADGGDAGKAIGELSGFFV
jgi:phosphotransferase system HPr (HPr) family protein